MGYDKILSSVVFQQNRALPMAKWIRAVANDGKQEDMEIAGLSHGTVVLGGDGNRREWME